jgi:hypothetical protein
MPALVPRCSRHQTAASGHENQFPPRRLNAGFVIRKQTFAEPRRSGSDAPTAVTSMSLLGIGCMRL